MSEGLCGLHICDAFIPWRPVDAAHELGPPVTYLYGLVFSQSGSLVPTGSIRKDPGRSGQAFMTQPHESQSMTFTTSISQKYRDVEGVGRNVPCSLVEMRTISFEKEDETITLLF